MRMTRVRPVDWKPGDFLPGIERGSYATPMFEFKPNHRGDFGELEIEGGCECETYGDDEWARFGEAMRWAPGALERQRAALDLPEED